VSSVCVRAAARTSGARVRRLELGCVSYFPRRPLTPRSGCTKLEEITSLEIETTVDDDTTSHRSRGRCNRDRTPEIEKGATRGLPVSLARSFTACVLVIHAYIAQSSVLGTERASDAKTSSNSNLRLAQVPTLCLSPHYSRNVWRTSLQRASARRQVQVYSPCE
jgi:hypothetical protein